MFFYKVKKHHILLAKINFGISKIAVKFSTKKTLEDILPLVLSRKNKVLTFVKQSEGLRQFPQALHLNILF